MNNNELSFISVLIEKTFPMPGKFRSSLPSQVAELSRLLTGARGDRSLSYLSRPNFLSAYLHYFLPWNLFRLCRLLPGLDIKLSAGDKIVDLGSGPLTFVLALWITHTGLRDIPLEFYCIDRSSPALEAGKKLFTAIAGGNSPWKINLVRQDIDFRPRGGIIRHSGTHTAALVCAVNLFNEVYENIPHTNTEKLKRMAANIAGFLHAKAAADGCILTVEPGIPQSGRFISFLREAFLELGRPPLSPCPHTEPCPIATEKKRWCHFAFETRNNTAKGSVPMELVRLSKAAGLTKERLVYSYLQTGAISQQAVAQQAVAQQAVCIISDAFPLPGNRFGRYGCCKKGLVLLTGDKSRIDKIVSGSLVSMDSVKELDSQRDAKSGALIMGVI
jgi:ribosomal protein RSM22 (predicted rRNA methylase)